MKNEDLYPKPMTKEEFFTLAKNRNRYRVAKPLTGELAYAKIGDTYYSDTLYERGYNMYALVESGVLELIPQVFPFEKEIEGMNVHSVYTLCPECRTWGINMPMEKTCGDCGYTEGHTYYDAETIDKFLRAQAKKVKVIDDQAHVMLSLPSDGETEKWYNENIAEGCSASSAIYKFRLWLKERMEGNGA